MINSKNSHSSIPLLINDMVETDKVGTFFFMNMALIVNMEIRSRREENPSIGS